MINIHSFINKVHNKEKACYRKIKHLYSQRVIAWKFIKQDKSEYYLINNNIKKIIP